MELPARRTDIELHTSDGLRLVGELAEPLDVPAVATIVCLHPLPTGGGFMDSHIIRKAAARLPALARIAVLRFNFRGVTSPRGHSEGSFGDGIEERKDLEAAIEFVTERGLPTPWLVGWSFGPRSRSPTVSIIRSPARSFSHRRSNESPTSNWAGGRGAGGGLSP